MKKKILLTGATGALGGELLPRLLAEGNEVICLVRPLHGQEPHERLPEQAREMGEVKVIGGDVTRPLCSVSANGLSRLRAMGITHFVHSAASIKFNDEPLVRATNINGVGNALALADALGIRSFLHISTSYVAGEASSLCESDAPRDATHPPRNPYEASKQMGEALLRDWGGRGDGRRYSIVRPSILTGCEDGTTPTFDGYYGYFRPLDGIAEALRRRLKKAKAIPLGITVGTNEWVNLPLVLLRSAISTLNLVPIDWVAEMIVALLDAPAENRAYHLVDRSPMPVREVIDSSLEFLRISGVQCVDDPSVRLIRIDGQEGALVKLQKQVDMVHQEYWPYVTHGPIFADGAAAGALGSRFRPAPRVNREFLHTLLDYAVSANFNLREPAAQHLVPA